MSRIGIAHFRSQRSAGPMAPRPSNPGPFAPQVHPLAELLRSLQGREIAVLISGREIEGRLITFAPVTIASSAGRVTVLPLDRISSVRY